MKSNPTLWVVAFALTIALACSSEDDPEGGGLDQALGAQMSALSDLGSQYIDANQGTYDTVGNASALIGDAIAAGLPAPSTVSKQAAGCLPEELAGQAFLVDVLSSTFTPDVPRGTPNTSAVQFVLLSGPGTEEGYVNVTCDGILPNPIVTVSVNTVDDVEVLNLQASVNTVFPPSNFNASLVGVLRNAAGDEVPFGAFGFGGGSSIGLADFSRFASTSFLVSDTVTASVQQSVSTDPSFASEDINIMVQSAPNFDQMGICPSDFFYSASAMGLPGTASGGAFYCAAPPAGDDFNRFVHCLDGSTDDMVVSVATEACMLNIFEGDPTVLPTAGLAQIQEAIDALFGMHNAVIAVVEAGGEVALKVAEAAQQQF